MMGIHYSVVLFLVVLMIVLERMASVVTQLLSVVKNVTTGIATLQILVMLVYLLTVEIISFRLLMVKLRTKSVMMVMR